MNKLKELRKSNNITQKELSEKSKIPLRSISAYEQGVRDIEKIELKKAIILAEILHCSVKDLYE